MKADETSALRMPYSLTCTQLNMSYPEHISWNIGLGLGCNEFKWFLNYILTCLNTMCPTLHRSDHFLWFNPSIEIDTEGTEQDSNFEGIHFRVSAQGHLRSLRTKECLEM